MEHHSVLERKLLRLSNSRPAIAFTFAALTIFSAVMCGIESMRVGLDANWDLLNYHLYNGFSFITGRAGVDVAPAQLGTYLNPVLDVPFYVLLLKFNTSPWLISFVMGSYQGFNVLFSSLIAWETARYLTASLVSRAICAILGTAISVTGAGAVGLIGTTFGDLQITTWILLSVWLCLVALRYTTQTSGPSMSRCALALFAAAGFFSGVAAGLKLTAAVYTLSLATALPIAYPRSAARILGIFLASALVGVLSSGGSHFMSLYTNFGSPLFPFYNGIFRAPGYELTNWSDDAAFPFFPKTVFEAAVRPLYWIRFNSGVVSEAWFRDMRFAAIWVLSAFCIFTWLMFRTNSRSAPDSLRQPATRFVIGFAATSYFLWQWKFSVYRYLIPIEMISGPLIAIAISWLCRRQRWRNFILLALTVGLVVTTKPARWSRAQPEDGRYVAIRAPSLPPDALIAVATKEAVSYLVPFLPPTVRWVSISNNLFKPSQSNATVQRGFELIRSHNGPVFSLENAADSLEVRNGILSKLALVRLGPCSAITSNLTRTEFALCPVSGEQPEIRASSASAGDSSD